ncbi:MAG: hypothetical protein ACAH06_13240 [Methylophilaceae bacterium]
MDEFERLKTGAEVLEQDAHGLKVLCMPNGDILKLFRVKRLVSSVRLYSHVRSFCRNAERLRALGIPTVTIRQLYHSSDRIHSAVLYQPLPGKTLRPEGSLGLIDIADLSIQPFALSCTARRNFRHLCRLAPDRLVFGKEGWELFLRTYRETARLRLCSEKSFSSKAARLFDVWSLREGRL